MKINAHIVIKENMKITIKQYDNKEELEFVRLDTGEIMNYGRSLPF